MVLFALAPASSSAAVYGVVYGKHAGVYSPGRHTSFRLAVGATRRVVAVSLDQSIRRNDRIGHQDRHQQWTPPRVRCCASGCSPPLGILHYASFSGKCVFNTITNPRYLASGKHLISDTGVP